MKQPTIISRINKPAEVSKRWSVVRMENAWSVRLSNSVKNDCAVFKQYDRNELNKAVAVAASLNVG